MEKIPELISPSLSVVSSATTYCRPYSGCQTESKNTDLPYNPTIPLMGIYLSTLFPTTDINVYLFVFRVTLFIRAGILKQSSYPLADEWIMKMY